MKKRKWLYAGLGLFVLACLVIAGVRYFNRDKAKDDQEPAIASVQVMAQEPIILEGKVSNKSMDDYMIDQSRGNLDNVLVTDGQEVKAGDALFSYRKPGVKEQIEDARRQLNRLYSERANLQAAAAGPAAESLKSGPFVAQAVGQGTGYTGPAGAKPSGPDLDQTGTLTSPSQAPAPTSPAGLMPAPADSGASLRQLNQQIEDAEIQLSRLQASATETVTARNGGRVQLNEKGRTTPTVPFIRIASDELCVNATVSEYQRYAIREGENVDVRVLATEHMVTGTIDQLDKLPIDQQGSSSPDGQPVMPSAMEGSSQSTYAFSVKLKEPVDNGFSVEILVPLKGYAVPETALFEEKGQTYVYVFEDGRARKRPVQVEEQGQNKVITSGIKEGDFIGVNANELVDGQEVPLPEDGPDSGQDQAGESSPAGMVEG